MKPHIIVIVYDDQEGYSDAGFHDSEDIHPSQLDAMAKEGVRCTRGYWSIREFPT